MKTAVSLPDPLFEAAESLAHQMHMTRSYFYALAIREFVEKNQKNNVTAALDAIYAKEDSRANTFVDKANQFQWNKEIW